MELQFTTGQIRPAECVKEGFRLIKQDYWLLFAITIIGLFIGGFSFYILLGAMFCGVLTAYLRVFDGGRADFNDLWKGFDYFGKSLLAVVVILVPGLIYGVVVLLTIYLPIIAMAVSGGKISPDELIPAFIGALVIDVIVALLMVGIHSLLMFVFPLIVDRGLSSWDAIKLSARATLKNLGGVAGLIAVNIGLAILGYLAFCVGVYLAIPIIMATNLVAYRQVFPKAAEASY
ncbi:MAG: hypothetical protein UZ17_ACD001000574 [Acidobacteria bacterium OLB17]|nr:MAG: hypothetical protein UZ17_ACD001000574 [Acidobacteria bacterium OLB17]MCZ2389509.1 hypothetical protein [Acidobacteriota bacterium]